MAKLITNGKIITWEKNNRILEEYAIYIEDGRIVEIDNQAALIERYPQAQKIDAGGQLVMPGNICTHTHFYGAFARGMAIPGSPPKDFPEILEKLWWPLDRSLTLEDVHASAQIMLMDAVKNGTTTLFDHHASPNAIEGSLDAIANAVDEAGVRGVLCYEVTDRGGLEKSQAGIRENMRFIERTLHETIADRRVAATFGLHASLTLSEETLDACRLAAPDDVGFHIHVAEHEVDEYDSLAKCGTRVVDRLYDHQILGPKTIAVHAVHIDAREVELLADTDTWVTHQPRSNMNNGVGVANVESYLRAGVRVGIGTDGFPHNMWQEWKTTYFVHKLWNHDPRRMNGFDVIGMGVYNNAALANVYFPEAPLGVLQPGAYADIIFVDYHPFTPMHSGNLPWHILFGFNESMVTTTIVNGEILMRDRELLTMDEEAIIAHAMEISPAVWERYNQQF